MVPGVPGGGPQGFRERIFGADATAQSMSDHIPEVEKHAWFTPRKPERLWFKSIVRPWFCVSGLSPHQLEGPIIHKESHGFFEGAF